MDQESRNLKLLPVISSLSFLIVLVVILAFVPSASASEVVEDFTVSCPSDTKYSAMMAKGINIRSGASTSAEIVGYADAGDYVFLTGEFSNDGTYIFWQLAGSGYWISGGRVSSGGLGNFVPESFMVLKSESVRDVFIDLYDYDGNKLYTLHGQYTVDVGYSVFFYDNHVDLVIGDVVCDKFDWSSYQWDDIDPKLLKFRTSLNNSLSEFTADGRSLFFSGVGYSHRKNFYLQFDDSPTLSYQNDIDVKEQFGNSLSSHNCSLDWDLWYSYYLVTDHFYYIWCDCGWSYSCEISSSDIFSGLVLNAPERLSFPVDLYPGDFYVLSHSPMKRSDVQVVQKGISGGYDNVDIVINIIDSGSKDVLFSEIVNVGVKIQLTDYFLEFYDSDGEYYSFSVNENIYVFYYDAYLNYVHLAKGSWFYIDSLYLDFLKQLDDRTFVLDIEIKSVDLSSLTFFERIQLWIDDIKISFNNFFNLFSSAFLNDLYLENILNFEGVTEFFNCLKQFFTCIPKPLIDVLTFAFVSFIIVGLMRWFK